MDINDLRSIMTVVSLFVFVGICVWALSKRNQQAFDEAAQLPFSADDAPASPRANT